MGASLNPSWNAALAERRIAQVGLDQAQKSGKLSGGQRAQLALTVAAAKQPDLLLLDEPVAALDPLARRAFLQGLMELTAERGISVIMSSHLVADLERVCDYLIVLIASQVRVAGDVDELLATHHRLTGPPARPRRARRRPGRGGPEPHRRAVDPGGPQHRADRGLVLAGGPAEPGGHRARLHERGRPAADAGGTATIWFAWRQFRTQALSIAALMLALIGALTLTWAQVADLARRAGRRVSDCAARAAGACSSALSGADAVGGTDRSGRGQPAQPAGLHRRIRRGPL
jgi:hypothetical protein